MTMFVNRRARLLEELLGIQEEIFTINDALFDINAGTIKAGKSRIKNLNGLLSDLHSAKERTALRLKSLGISLATINDGTGERYAPLTLDGTPIESKQPQQGGPSNWKKYGAYFAAGVMIGAAVLGFWGGPLILKSWSSGHVDYTHPTNETKPNRREENNTTELPEVPYQQPAQNQTQDQTQNQMPLNQTPINQTPDNQSALVLPTVDTPDYLKYLNGIFTGDTFLGNYGIADAEHNPNGNYSLRVRDSGNRTILETDLNDSESDHGFFSFDTNSLKQNKEYFVEVLRNGMLAHEPLKFIIPNNPPAVRISADARLGKDDYRAVDYTLSASDDREVVDAEVSLVNASGGNVIQLKKFDVRAQYRGITGILLADKNVPASKYHVLAKARDNEGSYSEAVADVDLPELPVPPPPPPPPPHINVPPQIVGVAWAYDKDRDKFIADVDINDPDGPNLSLEQKLLDNGSNVNAPMTSQVSGSRIHSEANAQGLDSVYDWNLTVKDGANGTATQILKNVWAWMRGLVGYWKFDGNGTDSIAGNNASLMNGAGFAQGKKGQALKLDGVDDYAEIPPSLFYGANIGNYHLQEFTVSLWFNASELAGKNYRGLFFKGNYGDRDQQGFMIMTGEGQYQDNIFIMGFDSTEAWRDWGATPKVDVNKTYHLSITYCAGCDGDGLITVKTFLDGKLVDQQELYYGAMQKYAPLRIGYKYDAAGVINPGYWNGKIDDVRFYSKALSDKEIQAIFKED